jgi:peptidoglycan/xylan/chitin deacetylase (PgdA/CDA1 family)
MNPWLAAAPIAFSAGAAFTAYAAVNPRSELFGPVVWHTKDPQKLAITFDDGPNPSITPELLNVLDEHSARATFFVMGRFASAPECSGLVRDIFDRGHLIGNHTQTHPNLFFKTATEIRDELRRCNDAISAVTNRPTQWFRPPFGFRNPWVVSTAAALGMKTMTWSLIPGDWKSKPEDWLIRRMEPIATQGSPHGSILCLHDGDFRFLNGDRTATIAALRYWLPRWRDLGLEFVTIDQAVQPAA